MVIKVQNKMKQTNLILLALALAAAPLLISCATPTPTPTLDPPMLLQSLRTKEKMSTNVLISLHPTSRSQDVRTTLQILRHEKFTSRAERLNLVAKTLKDHTQTAQKSVLNFLTNEKAKRSTNVNNEEGHKTIIVKQLWISNQIIVKNVDLSLLEGLMGRGGEISKIEEEKFFQIGDPFDFVETEENYDDGGHFVQEEPYQWGVQKVGAPFYNLTKGEEIVIASIDTGARMTHEALFSRYRLDYGWFDTGEVVTRWPYDDHGHGTHTIGTMLGVTKGIGVAPGAQWISCKAGSASGQLSSFNALICGQWVLCPTNIIGENEDCSKAPHIVSNSWMVQADADGFFDDVISAWRTGGIIPIFGIGNSGPPCNTTHYPGNHPDVIGVGALTQDNKLANFSSMGPVTGAPDLFKPDVVAPGSPIYSAYITNDTAYAFMEGTSMACPHVSGLVALMLGMQPDLDFDQIRDILRKGALPIQQSGGNCGEVSQAIYPNHKAGYGQVDGVKIIDVMTSSATSFVSFAVGRSGLAFLMAAFMLTVGAIGH